MRPRSERRGNWYLLTGVILGLVLGLIYAWVVSPVEYVDAGPYSLRADFKDQYRLLVALAYLTDNNFIRAQARLDQLKDPDIASTVAMQAQQYLAKERPELETRALSLLAVALGEGPTPVVTLPTASISPTGTVTITPTPVLVDPTNSPETNTDQTETEEENVQSTATPLPTRTPTATPGAPFLLRQQNLICDPGLTNSVIQVYVYDAADQEVPGVEVIINWDGSEEHFFTGLKPELGLGYADFNMTIGVNYVLHLADGGESVPNLTAAECEGEDGSRYYGSWLLVFRASGR
jgi:hypothetical protein